MRNWVPFRNFWDNQPAGRSICVGLFFLIIGYFWLAFTFRLGQFEHFEKKKLNYVFCLEFYNTIPGYISLFFNVILILIAFLFILGHRENRLELSYKV